MSGVLTFNTKNIDNMDEVAPLYHKPLVLEDYQGLFVTDAAYKRFVEIITAHLEQRMSIIVYKDEPIGFTLSKAEVEKVLVERYGGDEKDTGGV